MAALSLILKTASSSLIYTAAAAVRCTTDDAAAGHEKFALNTHTAAVDRRAADDAAAPMFSVPPGSI